MRVEYTYAIKRISTAPHIFWIIHLREGVILFDWDLFQDKELKPANFGGRWGCPFTTPVYNSITSKMFSGHGNRRYLRWLLLR